MENQTPNMPPKRKRIPPRDLILIALAVLVMFRVDWSNMNSFHYLILFMLVLCFMLRWSNMRKEAIKKQDMERYRAQYEAEAAKEVPALTENSAPVSAPIDGSAAELTADAPTAPDTSDTPDVPDAPEKPQE